MIYLLLVSLLWAFSFGAIKQLAGLDAVAVAVVRLALALLIFLPFLRPARLTGRQIFVLAGIGGVQFGLMYVFYLQAFASLQAYEVAIFTIFTPIYVALIDGLLQRRIVLRHVAAAALAVGGAAVMLWQRSIEGGSFAGFLLVQASNLCFAAGQIAYKRWRPRLAEVADGTLFGWLYLGAVCATGLLSLVTTSWAEFQPSAGQGLILLYLGMLASGLGFFGWNLGALRVNAGTLAAFNNLKIPLAVACSLLFFGERADLSRLILSAGLMAAAIVVAESGRRPPAKSRGAP